MGLQQQVTFEDGHVPAWTEVREELTTKAFAVQLRMIDGELVLQEELPSEAWKELRVGTPHGMVTLRRELTGIQFVIWGNADALLQQARNALVWAFAARGNGKVVTETGTSTAAEFARNADLPPAMRGLQ